MHIAEEQKNKDRTWNLVKIMNQEEKEFTDFEHPQFQQFPNLTISQ